MIDQRYGQLLPNSTIETNFFKFKLFDGVFMNKYLHSYLSSLFYVGFCFKEA